MEEDFDIRRGRMEADRDFERALRPDHFGDFIGKDKII